MSQDTNFDHLAEHFQKKIYGSKKGKIRLAVLERDLEEQLPYLEREKQTVLDIGAGMAQMGLALAEQGHDVCINDISENMLALAKKEAKARQLDDKVRWDLGPFQNLPEGRFDLVLCHAVLEWLEQPHTLLEKLGSLTVEGGVVSLMFYNFDALVFHNLIRGNFNKINSGNFSGMQGGLTPPNPVKLDWVEERLLQNGFEVFYRSGIRVFNDYVGVKRGGNEDEQSIIEMELRFSNQEPYLRMGRYIHLLCRRA